MLDRKGFIDAAAKVKDLDQLKNDSWGLTSSSLSFIFRVVSLHSKTVIEVTVQVFSFVFPSGSVAQPAEEKV